MREESNNWAIIGKGFIYDRHAKAIEHVGDRVQLTCDNDPSKGADFTDWVEMINHPAFDLIDCVAICTPNYLHAVIARECILKGKRVLCEKPLTIDGWSGLDQVKAVLQLRYHPAVKMLRLNPPKKLDIVARMYRDESYWNSWKGNHNLSGGILYNLGIHYLDLLIHIFGDKYEIISVDKEPLKISGVINFKGKPASFCIEVVDNRDRQERKIIADGAEVVLSSQDNLSYEDLHKEVYKDFVAGSGVSANEAVRGLKLVREIHEMQ